VTPQEEIGLLRKQAEFLSEEMKEIQERISALEAGNARQSKPGGG
jgi:hypothetical protein